MTPERSVLLYQWHYRVVAYCSDRLRRLVECVSLPAVQECRKVIRILSAENLCFVCSFIEGILHLAAFLLFFYGASASPICVQWTHSRL